MNFRESLEAVRAETADVRSLFAGDGTRSTSSPKAVAEAIDFMADILDGKRPIYHLREAMTTSDFPVLFTQIIDRQVLAAYREAPSAWDMIARRRVVRDFRATTLVDPLIGNGGRLNSITELAEYPQPVEPPVTDRNLQVRKWGAQFGISWEMLINDDLDQIRALPIRLGSMARRTENYEATATYAGASGPSAGMFDADNTVLIANAVGVDTPEDNPPLSVAGLTQAMNLLLSRRDADGNLIARDTLVLVVPPALEVVANNIINATTVELTTMGGILQGSAEQRLIAANWLSRRIRVMSNPILPQISTTNGNTSWYLFADPANDREAFTVGFLRGHEDPEVFMRSSNAMAMAGGAEVDPMNGDFDNDAVTYKVRHIFGTAVVDPKAAVASNGTGTD